MELDIRGGGANKEEAELRRWALLQTCQSFFVAIKGSEGALPFAFRVIFSHVRDMVTHKWPINSGELAMVVSAELSDQVRFPLFFICCRVAAALLPRCGCSLDARARARARVCVCLSANG